MNRWRFTWLFNCSCCIIYISIISTCTRNAYCKNLPSYAPTQLLVSLLNCHLWLLIVNHASGYKRFRTSRFQHHKRWLSKHTGINLWWMLLLLFFSLLVMNTFDCFFSVFVSGWRGGTSCECFYFTLFYALWPYYHAFIFWVNLEFLSTASPHQISWALLPAFSFAAY